MKMKNSLMAKLLVVLLSIVVLSNLLIGIASQIISRGVVSDAVRENLTNVAAKTAVEIYSVNDNNFNMLNSLATQPFMKDADVSTDEKNEMVMSIAKRNLTKFKNVNYIDKSGMTVTLDGKRHDFSQEAYFREAMSGKQIVTDPATDSASGQTLMYYAVPVFNRHHVPSGVLVAAVFGDRLSQIVSTMQVGKHAHPIVVNIKSGAIIGQFAGALNVDLPDGKSGSAALADIVRNMREGKTGGGVYIDSVKKEKMTCMYQKVGENCDWAVFCAAPYSDYFGGLQKLSVLILSILGTSIAVAVASCVIMLSWSLKPLKLVDSSIHEIARGNADLSRRIKVQTKDEIGSVVDGFNLFTEKLQSIIARIQQSNAELGNAGGELDESTQDTAGAITEIIANIESVHSQISSQSESVAQTAGAVNEIASNITSLENMIQAQASGVSEASAAVEEMIGNIASVTTSMDKMAQEFESLQENAQSGFAKQTAVNERIQQIEKQSKMLEDANKTIASIARQTNMLAMNAAIEAAHAGDVGRGFSVVADEIRNLAETSASQSKTINVQLSEIRKSIADVVEASTESSAVLGAVASQISETDQLVRQMKASMQEQNEGSKQITSALSSMNDSTGEVRTASKEMAEGNKLILSEVKNLQDATLVMLSSMDEMSAGAERINTTGAHLSDISLRLKNTISQIGSEINQFEV